MFPLVVCTFFIGILASLHMLLPDVSKIRTEAIDDSVAVNFCLYRTAVTQYLGCVCKPSSRKGGSQVR